MFTEHSGNSGLSLGVKFKLYFDFWQGSESTFSVTILILVSKLTQQPDWIFCN